MYVQYVHDYGRSYLFKRMIKRERIKNKQQIDYDYDYDYDDDCDDIRRIC